MSNKFIRLESRYFLDEDWKNPKKIQDVIRGRYDFLFGDAWYTKAQKIGTVKSTKMRTLKTLKNYLSKANLEVNKLIEILANENATEKNMRHHEEIVALEQESLKKVVEKIERVYNNLSKVRKEDEIEWLNWIKKIRIEIAEASQTRKIGSDEKYDYLESEVGMNIIVPKGIIENMRFQVTLKAEHKVVAIDGFPKDVIAEKHLVGGKIKVAISKAFMFIPVVGPSLTELLDIELNPWEFKLGNLKRVNIDFSGGLTSRPEWYFKEDGIKNDLRVALTIRKPKNVDNIKGRVKAAWLYEPGFLKPVKLGTGTKTIDIF